MSRERLAYSNAESSSLVVQALCRDLIAGGVNFDIHADDEMLHFFLYSQGYPLEQAVAAYLDSGREIWRTVRQVLSWRFGSPQACGRILDFASGYGRVTRHIVAEVPLESVWVSDIYAEGVAFQERSLGVQGIVSTTDPEGFHAETRFDCILASSLFTHLPAARFSGWLRRLGVTLSPGGMLLFSVHDLSLWRDGPPPAPDIAFVPMSESGSLSPQEYGTTWVTEAYVRSVVKAELGDCAVLRIPRGLANFQDLYVVVAGVDGSMGGESTVFAGLRIERSIDGFVEHCSRCGPRGVRLSGWVGDRVGGRLPEEVRVKIDGVPSAACRELKPRSIQAFPSDPSSMAGWQLTFDLPPAATDSSVLGIFVLASDGEELELYSDSLLAALLRSARLDLFALQGRLTEEAALRETLVLDLNRKLDELYRQVRSMEASHFWKLRNHWFRFKRLARLTADP
jgi:SAM-dependent methyltransferase